MKDDLELKVKEKTKLEITQEKEQEFKLTLDSRIVPHENHTVWEINCDTFEIQAAQFEKTDYVFNPKWTAKSKPSSEAKIVKKVGFAYIAALTKKTALKKFKENNNGSKIDPSKEYVKL